jgi:hypothetical protein
MSAAAVNTPIKVETHSFLTCSSREPSEFPIGTVIVYPEGNEIWPGIVVDYTPLYVVIICNTWKSTERKLASKCLPATEEHITSFEVLEEVVKVYNKEYNANIEPKFL